MRTLLIAISLLLIAAASFAAVTDECIQGQQCDATAASTPVAVSALPTCNSGSKGLRRLVNNALTPVILLAVAGGGSVVVPVYCGTLDGVTYIWIVG